MLAGGGFPSLPAAPLAQLIYWRVKPRQCGPEPLKFNAPLEEVAAEALAGFESLMQAYQNPNQPYLSKPRVALLSAWGEYDHLARRDEWAEEEAE